VPFAYRSCARVSNIPECDPPLMAIPMPLLIGLNALRVLGVLFLLLAANRASSRRTLPVFCRLGRHHQPARFAIPLALSVARVSKAPGGVRSGFGISLGHSDLFAAVGLGHHLSSRKPTTADSRRRRVRRRCSTCHSAWYLPYWCRFYLITHAIIAAQLSARRSSAFRPERARACRCVSSGHAFSLAKEQGRRAQPPW